MNISELIPTVQFLFESYVTELVQPGFDKKYYKSLKKYYYRIYGNKDTMILACGKDNLPKVNIEGEQYYVEIKTSIDKIRSLALRLLVELSGKKNKYS